MVGLNASDALLRAATYVKWWRDGAIAEAELPDDINDVIQLLERVAVQFHPPAG
jgi:hypothetical protein